MRTLLVFLHGSGDMDGLALSTRLHNIPLPYFQSKTFKEIASTLNMDILLPHSKAIHYSPEFNFQRTAWHNRSVNFTELGRSDVEDVVSIDHSLKLISEIIKNVEGNYDLILIAGFSMGGGMSLQFLQHQVSKKVRGICSIGSFLTESSRVFSSLSTYSTSASTTTTTTTTKSAILSNATLLVPATSIEASDINHSSKGIPSMKGIYKIDENNDESVSGNSGIYPTTNTSHSTDSIQTQSSSSSSSSSSLSLSSSSSSSSSLSLSSIQTTNTHTEGKIPNPSPSPSLNSNPNSIHSNIYVDPTQIRKNVNRAGSFDLYSSTSSAASTSHSIVQTKRRLSVFLMHGRDDLVIPPEWGQNTAIQLSDTADDLLSVYFKLYDSLGHQINNHELQDLLRWCRHVINKESPFISHRSADHSSSSLSSVSSISPTTGTTKSPTKSPAIPSSTTTAIPTSASAAAMATKCAMTFTMILSSPSIPILSYDGSSTLPLSFVSSLPTRYLKIYTESQVYNHLRQHAGLCRPMELLIYFKRPKGLHSLTFCQFFTKYKYRCKLPSRLRNVPPADENIVGDSTNKMCYYRIHVPELRMFRLLCSREKQSATATTTATTTANFTIADNSTNSSTSSQVIAPAPAQTPTSIKHYIFARGQYQDNVPTFIEPIILPPSYKVPDEESVSVCGTDKEQSSSSSAGIEAELAVLERKLSFDDSISDSFSVFSLSSPTVEDSAIELYYLRLILLTRPVLSFEDARTGSDGTIYSTFKEAACSYQLTSKILSSKV